MGINGPQIDKTVLSEDDSYQVWTYLTVQTHPRMS